MKKTTFQDLPHRSGLNEGKTTKFYNTVNLTGNDLQEAKKVNESQETKILNFLKSKPDKSFTKSEIWERLVLSKKLHNRTPESSISRALSNLLNNGKVIKLARLRNGNLGKPNHLWKATLEPDSYGKQVTLF